jgi:hypothetical protein
MIPSEDQGVKPTLQYFDVLSDVSFDAIFDGCNRWGTLWRTFLFRIYIFSYIGHPARLCACRTRTGAA